MTGTNQAPEDREVRSRQITVQFFTLIARGVAPLDLCDQIADLTSGSGDENVVEIGRYKRDFWDLHRGKTYVRGQFRRWRMDEPPNIGSPGAAAPALDLPPGQGTANLNHFMFWPSRSLLAWQMNPTGSGPGIIKAALSELIEAPVEVLPVVTVDSAKRLMGKDAELLKVELSVAKPKNPDLYPTSEWGVQFMKMMNEADHLHLTLSVNSQKKKPGYISDRVKNALKEFAGSEFNPRVVRAKLEDEHGTGFIDLIADRIKSTQEVKPINKSYPPLTYYRAIKAARDERREDLNAVLGDLDSALD
jgi:hypothetical protein